MQILCAQQPKLFEAEIDDKSEDLSPPPKFSLTSNQSNLLVSKNKSEFIY